MAWIPDAPVEMINILRILQPQNADMKTGPWRVYNHGLGTDDALIKVLWAWNFKAFYNMQQFVFKPAKGMKEETGRPPAQLHKYGYRSL
jgi:hypothetical protein